MSDWQAAVQGKVVFTHCVTQNTLKHCWADTFCLEPI